jgi:hypothetical protein
MKKTLVISALCVGAISGYSQGTLTFANRLSDVTVHIYAPQVATPSVETTGDANSAVGVSADIYYYNGTDANVFNTAANTATSGGPTVYTGGAIGNTSAGNPIAAGAYHYNNGSDYTVELFAAAGLNAAASSLQPVSQYVSTIYTSSTLGGVFKNVSVAGDPGIPGAASGTATIELVAWYNGGVLPAGQTQATLSAQLTADEGGAGPYGMSLLDNLTGLYEGGAGTPPNMEGLQSFSLVNAVPEPSTIALGVIGASAFLFRRRK